MGSIGTISLGGPYDLPGSKHDDDRSIDRWDRSIDRWDRSALSHDYKSWFKSDYCGEQKSMAPEPNTRFKSILEHDMGIKVLEHPPGHAHAGRPMKTTFGEDVDGKRGGWIF